MRLAPFSTNKISEGFVVHRVHGLNQDVAALSSHTFAFTIPYSLVKVTGVEVIHDVLDVANMCVKTPDGLGGYTVTHYGIDVCVGQVVYRREAGYAVDAVKDTIIEITVDNLANETKKLGVNFLLHEVVEPTI